MSETEEDRIKNIKLGLDDYKSQGSKRTLTIMFRGKLTSLPVITVPLKILLLNHNNNRLSAQLDSHPGKDAVNKNPTSAESQSALRKLLSETDEFKDLKLQLKNLGQQEPGLVTRYGMLINGNTRLSALLELEEEGNAKGIDVAVLPESVTDGDLLDIEMTLQMTSLVHQDYSFTNELLLMKRYKDAGHSHKDLAKKMGWQRRGEKKAIQFLRILKVIEEVRAQSNSPLPYSVFDSKKQMLLDLDDKYASLDDSGDYQGAEALKWSRLTAMFLGINKDQVRAIDEDFFQERLIEKRLQESEYEDLRKHIESFEQNKPNDNPYGIFQNEDDEKNIGYSMKSVFNDLINSDDVRDEKFGVNKDFDGIYLQLSEEIRLASRAKISEENHASMMLEPARILREVRQQLDEINAQIPEVSEASDFKTGKFKYEVDKLLKSLKKLDDSTERYITQKSFYESN